MNDTIVVRGRDSARFGEPFTPRATPRAASPPAPSVKGSVERGTRYIGPLEPLPSRQQPASFAPDDARSNDRQMIPAALRAKLDAQAGQPHTVLTIEEFFDGNDDRASIGCNLLEPPALEEFRRVLLDVRARGDVQDVLMSVSEDMGEEWPFVDHVFVLTSASAADVGDWLGVLQADEPYTLDSWPGPTAFLPVLAEGMHVVVGWWD